MTLSPYSTRSAYEGAPLWCSTANAITRARADRRRRALGQLDEVGGETPGHRRRAREEHLHRRLDAGADARRARDDQRPRAPAELAIQHEERHAAEVVAVQVAQDDPADLARIDAGALQRDERGGAAVEEDGIARPREMQARLKPAAAAEGVARPDERELHALVPRTSCVSARGFTSCAGRTTTGLRDRRAKGGVDRHGKRARREGAHLRRVRHGGGLALQHHPGGAGARPRQGSRRELGGLHRRVAPALPAHAREGAVGGDRLEEAGRPAPDEPRPAPRRVRHQRA